MSETKHTPTPWTKNRRGELVGSNGDGITVYDLGISLAMTRRPQAEADGSYLLSAVNSYDKLVADRKVLLLALKEALCWFGNGCSAAAAGAQCETMYEAQEQGKEAIAQAERKLP